MTSSLLRMATDRSYKVGLSIAFIFNERFRELVFDAKPEPDPESESRDPLAGLLGQEGVEGANMLPYMPADLTKPIEGPGTHHRSRRLKIAEATRGRRHKQSGFKKVATDIGLQSYLLLSVKQMRKMLKVAVEHCHALEKAKMQRVHKQLKELADNNAISGDRRRELKERAQGEVTFIFFVSLLAEVKHRKLTT
jgi:hypothetical protein